MKKTIIAVLFIALSAVTLTTSSMVMAADCGSAANGAEKLKESVNIIKDAAKPTVMCKYETVERTALCGQLALIMLKSKMLAEKLLEGGHCVTEAKDVIKTADDFFTYVGIDIE